MTQPPSDHPDRDDEAMPMPGAQGDDQPPVRAFAQGVGTLLQTVGGVLFFSGCCVCASFGPLNANLSSAQVTEMLEQNPQLIEEASNVADPVRLGVALTVLFSTLAGVALAGFGLGLQGEARRSAWGALVSSIIFELVMLIAAGLLWTSPAPWSARIWNLALLLLGVVLIGFSAGALRNMLRHPPPPDLHVLPPDFEYEDPWMKH